MSKKKEKKEIDPQAWMFSFSDLLTNMLTFFVLLYSMSSMNDLAFEHYLGPSLRGALGAINRGELTNIGKPRFMPVSLPPTEEFAQIEDALIKALLSDAGEEQPGNEAGTVPQGLQTQTIDIYANNKFAQILFPAQILFDKNSAQILPHMARHLKGIAEILTKFAHPVRINGFSGRTEGTDKGADLSLRRASAVLNFLVSQGGLAPERCSLAGYGSLRYEERRGKSEDYVEIYIIKAANYTT
ncbi:MAG: flagellar motor protein MotB [bacterium]